MVTVLLRELIGTAVTRSQELDGEENANSYDCVNYIVFHRSVRVILLALTSINKFLKLLHSS